MLIKKRELDREPEFKKVVLDFFENIDESTVLHKEALLDSYIKKIITPDKVITFDIEWIDDNGVKKINKGYRVQHSNANGPYKGGLRFSPNVNESIFKMLAFEQTFKNVLTGLPMGGAKGGSDFDPKGKSQNEIETFCKAFIRKLAPYIGVDKDIPAGDLGVGGREIEIMFKEYMNLTGKTDCALTGKPIYLGGSLCRKEATGYGLCYFAQDCLKELNNTSIKDKKVIISGSGNVAIYCFEKVLQLGGTVVAMSDSDNCIYSSKGLDLKIIKEIKEKNHGRIREYFNFYHDIKVMPSKDIWGIKCDIAFPCACQFELDENDAIKLVNNSVIGVFEGANMPCTLEAKKVFLSNNIIFSPGKASNAGGVAVSGLEIEQNVKGIKYTFEEVDKKLKEIMHNIFVNVSFEAKRLKCPLNLIRGANSFAYNKIFDLIKEKSIS